MIFLILISLGCNSQLLEEKFVTRTVEQHSSSKSVSIPRPLAAGLFIGCDLYLMHKKS